jgi:hypothetical protein
LAFVKTFDRFQSQIGELTLQVTKFTISLAFDLVNEGERWLKKGKWDEKLLNQFLKPEYTNSDWSRGIPSKWLQYQWRNVMGIVQRYVTCEGRFSLVNKFHMGFLLHISGDR